MNGSAAHTSKRICWAGMAVVAALLAVTGCTGTTATPSPSASTSESSASASPAPASSAPPASGRPSASASAGGGGSAPAACASGNLRASVATVPGGASAGHQQLKIVLSNTGAAPCALQGWPGVSFVGQGNGMQLGAAARRDRSSASAAITLAPGASAHANLQVTNAANFDPSACGPTAADGLRVYSPGERDALFAPAGDLALTACVRPAVQLLTVQALQPGA